MREDFKMDLSGSGGACSEPASTEEQWRSHDLDPCDGWDRRAECTDEEDEAEEGMRFPKRWMDYFRMEYPLGSRIQLKELLDSPDLVEPGAVGTLYCFDNEGVLHIKLDDGRDLDVDVIYDSFEVLPPDDHDILPNEEQTFTQMGGMGLA